MTVDARLLVSDAQAVTTTAVSTDAIPLGLAGLDVGTGEPVSFAFQIDVKALVAGTETYKFQVIGATADNLTSGQVILAERAFTTAQAAALNAGTIFYVSVPAASLNAGSLTHIGARYETANSAGVTVTAFLTPDVAANQRNANIRSGFSVAS
jgi:hypothetical protein